MVALEEYLKTVKEKIKNGIGNDAQLAAPIEMELTTTTNTQTGGGLQIQIVELGAKISAEEVHRIKIRFELRTDLILAKERAELSELTEREAKAKMDRLGHESWIKLSESPLGAEDPVRGL